jgi:hypothetical protein
MKSYPPIKRHDALVAFSKDHHFGLLLVWKIRQGLAGSVDANRISNYVLFCFAEDLQYHFREEEQLMFSKLPAGDILRVQVEQEHQTIYKLIDKVGADKTNPVLLKEFADTLEKHIRFEERILFKHIQETIGADVLETIASYHGTPSGNIDSRWNDPFWEKGK